MTDRKLLLPPLAPLALLLLVCGWIVSLLTGGTPDNDPWTTALFVATSAPVLFFFILFYLITVFCNLMDSFTDRLGPGKRWLGTGGLVLASGTLYGLWLNVWLVDDPPAFAIGRGVMLFIAAFLPMAFIRRHLLREPPHEGSDSDPSCYRRKPTNHQRNFKPWILCAVLLCTALLCGMAAIYSLIFPLCPVEERIVAADGRVRYERLSFTNLDLMDWNDGFRQGTRSTERVTHIIWGSTAVYYFTTGGQVHALLGNEGGAPSSVAESWAWSGDPHTFPYHHDYDAGGP